jgi:spermidine/putrescine transport system permease protein
MATPGGQKIFGLYLALFIAYLFFPLILMSAAAFNAWPFPGVIPWTGFTLAWFDALAHDRRLWGAVGNSAVIGLGVVLVAVPVGLAAALLLDNVRLRTANALFAVMVSPILIPGVILGVSALIFWHGLGIDGGFVVTVLGQSSYVAAMCMLLFMARLQRFDRTLEEAALDLGARPALVFRRILLPYLWPAILGAAALAFLQSFESFNTAIFTIGTGTTMTIEIASKVRSSITPAVNALGLVFLIGTVVAAVVYELARAPARERAVLLPLGAHDGASPAAFQAGALSRRAARKG